MLAAVRFGSGALRLMLAAVRAGRTGLGASGMSGGLGGGRAAGVRRGLGRRPARGGVSTPPLAALAAADRLRGEVAPGAFAALDADDAEVDLPLVEVHARDEHAQRVARADR